MTPFFSNIVSRVRNRFSTPKVILGRWTNEECVIRTQTKTDLANEDHCSCDDYLESKRKELENREREEIISSASKN